MFSYQIIIKIYAKRSADHEEIRANREARAKNAGENRGIARHSKGHWQATDGARGFTDYPKIPGVEAIP